MPDRQPTPGVHENFASTAETSFRLDHGDELVAGHPPRLASAKLTNEGHQPNLAADLDGEVGSLEHDSSPFPEENSTGAGNDLTEGNHRVCTSLSPPPQSHLVGIEEGTERAARYIEKQRDDYVQEFGNYDPSTGVTEFSTAGEEHLSTLEELIEGIRALHERAHAPVSNVEGRVNASQPTGWALTDVNGRVSTFSDEAFDGQVWREQGYIVREFFDGPAPQPNVVGSIQHLYHDIKATAQDCGANNDTDNCDQSQADQPAEAPTPLTGEEHKEGNAHQKTSNQKCHVDTPATYERNSSSNATERAAEGSAK